MYNDHNSDRHVSMIITLLIFFQLTLKTPTEIKSTRHESWRYATNPSLPWITYPPSVEWSWSFLRPGARWNRHNNICFRNNSNILSPLQRQIRKLSSEKQYAAKGALLLFSWITIIILKLNGEIVFPNSNWVGYASAPLLIGPKKIFRLPVPLKISPSSLSSTLFDYPVSLHLSTIRTTDNSQQIPVPLMAT